MVFVDSQLRGCRHPIPILWAFLCWILASRPIPSIFLGATGAQAVVAGRIRATFAARDRRKGAEPAVLTESGFFRKLR